MLVLGRRVGQRLMIGDSIVLSILETRGETVKLGIEAPREVAVYREEIFEEIRQANSQAATKKPQQNVLDRVHHAIQQQQPPKEPQ